MTVPLEKLDTLLPAQLRPAEAVALSRALVAKLEAERGVDSAVKKSGRALKDAGESLRVGWEAGVRGAIARDHGASAQRADHDEDAVWLALYSWLKGWAQLPAHLAPESATAQLVLRELFPNGAGFTDLTYALEWVEADRLITLVDVEGHATRIESLGGAALLRAVRAAHAEYERVLGVSLDRDPYGEALAPLVQSAMQAVRAYMSTVLQSAGRDTGARARAEELLAPLQRWAGERDARERRQSLTPSVPR